MLSLLYEGQYSMGNPSTDTTLSKPDINWNSISIIAWHKLKRVSFRNANPLQFEQTSNNQGFQSQEIFVYNIVSKISRQTISSFNLSEFA